MEFFSPLGISLGEYVLAASACVLTGLGLYWFTQYWRILIYVAAHHYLELLSLGIAVKKMLYAQAIFQIGFLGCIASIPLAPSLFWPIFLITFVLSTPLYFSAQQSSWNYVTKFWWCENENFGDGRLSDIRNRLKHVCRLLMRVSALMGLIGATLVCFGVILLIL